MNLAKEQLAALGSPAEQRALRGKLSARARFRKPLLKFFDEYNYAYVTKAMGLAQRRPLTHLER